MLCLSLYLYSFYLGTTGIVINEKNIINDYLPSSFYGFKIAHLSDVHYKNTTNIKELNKIVKQLNKSKPDIIIISGDLLDKDLSYSQKDINDISKALNNMNAKYKFIIRGENDLSETFNTIISKTDFELLDNTYKVIYNNDYDPIIVGGISTRNDKLDLNTKLSSIEAAIKDNKSLYNILIIHEPSLIKSIDYQNYQLILAGHTHQGQINIPGIKNLLIPEKDRNYPNTYYKLDRTELFISSGIGTHNLKARLFNKPSLNLYRLRDK